MWQVTYNPSVVMVPSRGVLVVGSTGDGARIQAPLLADKRTESSSGIAGEKPEVFLFQQTGDYCKQ